MVRRETRTPTSGLPVHRSTLLAQVVEQWTGNPEIGGWSPPSNHLIFGCLRNSYRFPL